ncbi:hypothetical protein QZH41_007341 [Actinostola sp. cb2023]|nr:hypothetical protein QZH41_007341 [Actinostola sp. cb2023]
MELRSRIEYKKVLRDVKEKKLCIEATEAEVKVSKEDFSKLQERQIKPQIGLAKIADGGTPTKLLNPTSGSSIRSVIITPKGTKRKVNPTHYKFKMDLNAILEANVMADDEGELTVKELWKRLEEVAPSVKRIERVKVLRTISNIFATTLKHRGKKREGYYSGLALRDLEVDCDPNTQDTYFEVPSVVTSPHCKYRSKVTYQVSYRLSRYEFIVSRYEFIVSRYEFIVSREKFIVSREKFIVSREKFIVSRYEFIPYQLIVLRYEFIVSQDKFIVSRYEFFVSRYEFFVSRYEFIVSREPVTFPVRNFYGFLAMASVDRQSTALKLTVDGDIEGLNLTCRSRWYQHQYCFTAILHDILHFLLGLGPMLIIH